jgi:integrase
MARKAKSSELQIRPTRNGFVTRVQINGVRQSIYGSTRTDVRHEAQRRIADSYDSRSGVASSARRDRTRPHTYDEACERLLATYPHRDSSKQQLEYNLAASRRRFGPQKLDQISRYSVELWDVELASGKAAARKKPLGSRTRRHYLAAMERVFTYADRHGWLQVRNPLEGLTDERGLGHDAVARTDKPDPFESWEQVFTIADQFSWRRFNLMVRFAAGLGLSPQEVICERACDVEYVPPEKRNDLNMGTVMVDRTWDSTQQIEHQLAKTSGRRARLVLTPLACEALDELAASGMRFGEGADDWRSSPLLFPDEKSQLVNLDAFRRGPWKQALKAAGVRHRGFKQCRHTFATLSLVYGGLDQLKAVSVALRHDRVSTTEDFYLAIVLELRRQAAGHVAAGMPLYSERAARLIA